MPCLQTQVGQRWALYLFWFGLVLIVALANPQGFLIVLEVFTSLALNLESGLFVGLMYYRAAKDNRVPFLAACGCSLCFPSCAGRSDRVRHAQNARLQRRRHSTAGDVVRTLEAKWDAVAARVKGGLASAQSPPLGEEALIGGGGENSRDTPSHIPTGGGAATITHGITAGSSSSPRAHVDEAELSIPLPLHPFLGSWLMWFAVVTFLGACVFDVWTALADLIGVHRTGWVFMGCLFCAWQVLFLPRVVGPHSFTVYHSLRLRRSGESRPLLQPASPMATSGGTTGSSGQRSRGQGGGSTPPADAEGVSPHTRDVTLPCITVSIASLGLVFMVPGKFIASEEESDYALAATLGVVLVACAVGAALVRFASRAWRAAFFLGAVSALMTVGAAVVAGLQSNVAGAALLSAASLGGAWEALLHAQTLHLNASMVARWQSPEGAAVWALRGSELADVVDTVQGEGGGATKWGGAEAADSSPKAETP